MKKLVLAGASLVATATVTLFQNCSSGSLPARASNASNSSSVSQVSAQAPCTVDGASVASGTTQTLYTVASVTSGVCPGTTQLTCSNGNWLGTSLASSTGISTGAGSSSSLVSYPAAYSSCSAPSGCTFNGTAYNSGDTTTAYSAAQVAYGSACSSVQQTLTCNNGTFTLSDGSSAAAYSSATCSVAAWVGNYVYAGNVLAAAYSNPGMPQCPQALGACTTKGQHCWYMNYAISYWGGWWDGSNNEFNSFVCK